MALLDANALVSLPWDSYLQPGELESRRMGAWSPPPRSAGPGVLSETSRPSATPSMTAPPGKVP